MADKIAYKELLLSLLPPGQIARDLSSNMAKLQDAEAAELARIDALARKIVDEADPRTTDDLFEDWETFAGLPDPCSGQLDTLQERRARLIQKLKHQGGQSLSFYESVAEELGYEITITEYKPFICGISGCGAVLNGGHDVRLNWKVTVSGPRLTYFRSGVSLCGEKLMSIARAVDLECIFSRLNQSHLNLIFSYEGV